MCLFLFWDSGLNLDIYRQSIIWIHPLLLSFSRPSYRHPRPPSYNRNCRCTYFIIAATSPLTKRYWKFGTGPAPCNKKGRSFSSKFNRSFVNPAPREAARCSCCPSESILGPVLRRAGCWLALPLTGTFHLEHETRKEFCCNPFSMFQ